MVKKKKGNEQSLYLLAIVSIVAIVGVVVLVLNAGGDEESSALVVDENGDVVGMALNSGMVMSFERSNVNSLKSLQTTMVDSESDCCTVSESHNSYKCCPSTSDMCKKLCS